MKLYIDHCMKLSEEPNMKLLNKLYNLEVSEDEVVVSNCDLQDISTSPFLNALHEHKIIAILDFSHNLLGNTTMEKLQQIFASSHKYRGLTLDLHCNQFGPSALFQICECPELFSRLEVLNLSQNRLTDSCGSYLSTILENCKALYRLNIEQCCLTSRTVQKIADALNVGSVLSELCIGRNNPISGNAMGNLLAKLATLKRFSELDLNGVKLSKLSIDGLCQLAKSSSLSGLMLGGTSIGTDAAMRLTDALSSGPQELVKLDLSSCGLISHGFSKICENIALIGCVLELNLGGNSIKQEGIDALVSFIKNPECALKVLVLNKCHLGLAGTLRILQALAGNESLEELNLSENADFDNKSSLQYDIVTQESPKSSLENHNIVSMPVKTSAPEETETTQQGLCDVNSGLNDLEVADSEDKTMSDRPALSDCNEYSTRSYGRDSLLDCQLVQDLSTAICMIRQLQLLDLSCNGFSVEEIEILYSAWSSSSRYDGSVQKHVKEQIVHFSAGGKRCCGVSSCCRR